MRGEKQYSNKVFIVSLSLLENCFVSLLLPSKKSIFSLSQLENFRCSFFNPLKGFRSLEQESMHDHSHDHRLLFRVTLGSHYLIKVQISLKARQLDL